MSPLITQIGEQQTAAFMLTLGRIGPLFLLAPIFSSRMLPVRVRGIAAVALALGLAPLAARGQRIPLEIGGLGELMMKEMLVGLAFAFAVGAVLAAVSVAGSLLDTLVGYSYGGLVDPLTGNQSSILAQIYGMVGILILIAIGGDALMIQGLARTYELVPLLDFPNLGALVAGAQDTFSAIFGSALELAAPVILAVVITDVAFGLLSRVVPQLNVFAVGFPAKIAVGMLMIAASLPFAGGWIADEMRASLGAAFDTIGGGG